MVVFKMRYSVPIPRYSPFVMYCVNGKPPSSLLIESTDSTMIYNYTSTRKPFERWAIFRRYELPYTFQSAYKSRFLLLGVEMYVKRVAYSLSPHTAKPTDNREHFNRDFAPRSSSIYGTCTGKHKEYNRFLLVSRHVVARISCKYEG